MYVIGNFEFCPSLMEENYGVKALHMPDESESICDGPTVAFTTGLNMSVYRSVQISS